MKTQSTKRVIALCLTMAMLLSGLTVLTPSVQADTTSDGAATVYDIYDLTGATEKNVNAWEATKIGSVAAEHKEQAAVKFNMNMTNARHRYRFSLGAQEGADCTDIKGYGLEIGIEFDGQNYVRFQRNSDWIANFSDNSGVIGEHDFEFGYRNIMSGDNIIGKQVYLSVDGVDLYTCDDTNYLTGDALGTMVALHHIDDAAVVLKSTYENGYGTAEVYDIYDLTGEDEKNVNAWEATKIGSVSAEHKEQVAVKFNMNMTNARHRYRFSLGAQEGADCTDIKGYGMEIGIEFDGQNYVRFQRNGDWIANFTDNSGVIGEHDFEFGYRNITFGNNIIGKQVYLSIDGVDLYTCDDTNYLTGDALGTMVAMHHIDDAAVVLKSTYENGYGTENVYDIFDLTRKASNPIQGTQAGNWSATVFGNVDAADKESVSVKANVSIMDGYEHRLSLGALESDSCIDVRGYGLILDFKIGKLIFARSGNWIASWDINNADMMGEYELEFGYRDILEKNQTVGKQIFLKKNGVVLYTHDDTNGYLTGDALGTKVALFHYGRVVQMDTTYEVTYGTENVYDVADLIGGQPVNSVNGTGKDNWSGTVLGDIAVADKENVSIKANVNVPTCNEYRLSLGTPNSDKYTDSLAYGLVLNFQHSRIVFTYPGPSAGTWLASWAMNNDDMLGEYELEFGYRDILVNNQTVGKQLFLKKNGVLLHTYDHMDGYLTGSALGTKVALFHYGTIGQVDTTKHTISYGDAKVYDIYDLTGATTNTIDGTDKGNWDAVVFGDGIAAADKENVFLKTKITITDKKEYRLSLGALDSDGCRDSVAGYGLQINVATAENGGYVALTRGSNGDHIKKISGDTTILMGQYELMYGYRDILYNGNRIGKQIIVAINGVVLYTHNDINGYLTGDALGTKVALFHYGSTVQMDSTAEDYQHPYTAETFRPDCYNAGKTVYSCIVCDHSYEETIAATGHTPAVDAAVAPVCGKTGLTEGQHCAACGEVLVAQQEVAALAHTETTGFGVAPECESTGMTDCKYCSVCNYVIEIQHVAPATGHTAVTDAYVAPTCTATGLTEGSHCSVCNVVLVAQNEIAATGHSYVVEAIEKTETTNPYLRRTCANCNLTEDKVLQFKSANLTLENDLHINFKVDASLFEDGLYTNPYAVFTLGNRVGENKLVVTEYTVEGDKYVFTCYGITASQIGDTVYATLYATYGGTEYSTNTMEYGVSKYCYNQLEKPANADNAELKTLLVDILNYGTAARTYTGYVPPVEQDQVMPNAALTEEQQGYATADSVLDGLQSVTEQAKLEGATATWKAASLELRDTVVLRVRFAVEDLTGVTVKMRMNGVEVEAAKIAADSDHEGQYYAYFNQLTGSQIWDQTVQFTVYKNGTAISNTLTYSVASYAVSMLQSEDAELVALVKALMKYGYSANAYIN